MPVIPDRTNKKDSEKFNTLIDPPQYEIFIIEAGQVTIDARYNCRGNQSKLSVDDMLT